LAKLYHAIQQWNHWLTHSLGHRLLLAEKKYLSHELKKYFGKHALLIGVPEQQDLLTITTSAHPVLLTSFIRQSPQIKTIESGLTELAILSGSIDMVILPHTLQYVNNPRQLLAEACRIIKPEGHIVILGFNPVSAWGLKKILTKNKTIPWSTPFIPAHTVKKWLNLEDFELIKQDTFLFRPPLMHQNIYHQLFFLEWLGRICYRPLGGVYMLIAKAKVIPLTPIRLRWQQKLPHVATIPKPSMREF